MEAMEKVEMILKYREWLEVEFDKKDVLEVTVPIYNSSHITNYRYAFPAVPTMSLTKYEFEMYTDMIDTKLFQAFKGEI